MSHLVVILCLSTPHLNQLMKLAHSQDMTTKEYVYISLGAVPSDSTEQPWGPTNGLTQSQINKLKAPFTSLKQVGLSFIIVLV